VFERVAVYFDTYPMVSAYNNLFKGGSTSIQQDPDSSSFVWVVMDNVFDGTSLDYGGNITHSNNAYIGMSNRLTPTNANDVVLSNLTYQAGPLSQYYIPSNCALVNAGSRTADLAKLYHHTATANQVKETNS